ncbi:14092_t:CDS:2 [Acaulospora colombiana]|uniref:14092_t:CDS:1 n=1 Tax=Acaulospora colombiana TaxID=27376 RepID=A0ACA9PTV5_9GLOM|nr:14092_t:CDS:2 [Acaulospora colombiana]
MTTVLNWLANFHGTFWGFHRNTGIQKYLVPPPLEYQGGQVSGIWSQGTYWYLDTRREEHQSVDEDEYGWLLKWTDKVDRSMKEETNKWGTLLHGDVKGANIVFSADSGGSRRCALYDFQYAGLGLVTRDLVYFIGTTAQSASIRRIEQEKEILRAYHSELLRTIASRQNHDQTTGNSTVGSRSDSEGYTFPTLWRHWEIAIVDWYRFMAGWGFWGNDSWVERRAKEIVLGWDEHTLTI